MSSVLTINGVAVSLPATVLPARLTAYVKDGIPTFNFSLRGGALPGLPDPYLGKECTLSIGGVQVFKGDVLRMDPAYQDAAGWVIQYTAFGLRNRGDYVPFTDDVTGLDTAAFNLPYTTDSAYLASRAGRTVGQILTTCLTMTGNANALAGLGIGNYGTLIPTPTLPAATVTDLAALTLIPPAAVYVSGEKMLGAIEAFLASWAPNVTLWVDPRNGTLRFLDLRTSFSGHTFTLGTDPIDPPTLSRDLSPCYSRVVVRGQPMVLPMMVSLSNGQLIEDFGHDGLTSDAAKAAWTDADFKQANASQDEGTCTCPSTTTITVTSSDTSKSWASDYWDQTATGAHGWIHLYDSLAINQLTAIWSSPVVANTSMSPGGPSTLTINNPLPATTYNSYSIFGLTSGASIVYRKYKVKNTAIGAALATQFMNEQPFVLAAGNASTLTSFPMGSVLWSSSGHKPYSEETAGITVDPSDGSILFFKPTWEVNQAPPNDVRALIAVNVRSNQVIAPTSGYEGTSYTVEDNTSTLTVTVDQWRDPGQASALQVYAQDVLDSVKDTVVEGTISYHGLFSSALLMGQAFTIASPYATGWEGLTLPCLECTLEWPQATGNAYSMSFHVSNRRAAYTAAAFLKPERSGIQIGGEEGGFSDVFSQVRTAGGLTGLAQNQAAWMSSLSPDLSTIPTSLEQMGVPTSIEQLGIPTDPGAYLPGAGAFNALGLNGAFITGQGGGGQGGGMGGGGQQSPQWLNDALGMAANANDIAAANALPVGAENLTKDKSEG